MNSEKQIVIDQMMMARVKRIGEACMKMVDSLQDTTNKGERLAAVVYLFKCIVDKHSLPMSELLASSDRFENKLNPDQQIELSGARKYIENEVI